MPFAVISCKTLGGKLFLQCEPFTFLSMTVMMIKRTFWGGKSLFLVEIPFLAQISFFGATLFFDTNPLFVAKHTDQGALSFSNKTSSEVKHCQLLQMELCVNLSSPSALRRAGYTHRAMQTGKHHVNLIVFVFDYHIFICICICICIYARPTAHIYRASM